MTLAEQIRREERSGPEAARNEELGTRMDIELELIKQLRAIADELESAWKALSYRPNDHVEAARSLIARLERKANDGNAAD